MHKVSVFDLDHTLFKANASFRFGVYLYKNNVFSTMKMLQLASYYAAFKCGLLSMQNLHHKIFKTLFLGESLARFETYAKDFLDQHFDALVNLNVLEKLNTDRSQGHYLAIFSSSPDFLVRLIAQKFEVNHWKASSYQIDASLSFHSVDGILTGQAKSQYLKSLIHTIGSNLDLCSAYSDSYEDLPLLELVGKPIAVNPDKKLYTHCLKKNWEMI